MARRKWAWLLPVGTFFLKNWTWLTSTALGAVMAWIASISPLVPKYAPFSYAVVFLASASVVMGIIALIAVVAERWAKRSFWLHVQEPARTVNPLEPTFTGIRVKLIDVADPDIHTIRGKTFVNCELLGNRLPYLYAGCGFLPRIELHWCDLIAIPYAQGQRLPPLHSTVIVTDCTFQNCRFYYQTMIVSEHDAREMNAAGNKQPWLVPPAPAK